jgi:hypothetical protein
MRVLALLLAAPALFIARSCLATAPIIYSASAYQSPVRADPDDLLLLPGYGFSGGDVVVYRALDDTAQPLKPPAAIPTTSNSSLGVADLVSVADAPYSLTIHLPAWIRADQTYALWAVNARGEWSNGVKINDARPLWISPDEVYSDAPLGSLPRLLKVIGRNLQPAPGAVTHVRLIGAGATYTLAAALDHDVDRYVAAIKLPTDLRSGRYRVQVSRDGRSWVSLANDARNARQDLLVLADPARPAQFMVGHYTFGDCIPSSGSCSAVNAPCLPEHGPDKDTTVCIAAAISAAHVAGGGVVVFPAGTWNMDGAGTWAVGRSYSTKGVSPDGILVPDGVSLRGAGRGLTRLVRGSHWDMQVPSFALLGHNTVSGFTFRDARVYQTDERGTAFLMLGTRWDRAAAYDTAMPLSVTHVVISDNEFDKPFVAVSNAGLGVDHLIVTHNIFGAFATALTIEGVPSDTSHRYHYSDSIVAYNKFFPGSSLNLPIGQGAIATGISGALRTDFSDNVADGTSTAYLYNPGTDPKGWRAAFFWLMHDNLEMTLVSRNSATCTGDKDGDGEAISYDNNHNRPGFASLAVPVIGAHTDPAAGTSAVLVKGSLIDKQISYGASIDVRPVNEYYVGDWLQIVRGAGIGQARKITRIAVGSDADGPNVNITVTPPFDALPDTGSLVAEGRIYWQAYTLANTIDHRTPLCLKSNRTRPSGGLIVLYASTVDSVVEGNTQYDTSGIQLTHLFQLVDPAAGVSAPTAFIQSSNEIRGNRIIGSYVDADKPLSIHGISIGYGATPHTEPPPILSFALSISHNLVSEAGTPKGAISFNQGWYTGPSSFVLRGMTPWKVADATLVFRNRLTDTRQPGANRVGIGLSADNSMTPLEWRSVVYDNRCDGAWQPQRKFVDLATQTIVYCPRLPRESCECGALPTDLGIASDSTLPSVEVGSSITYSLLVSNHGPNAASSAMLSAEPPAGIKLNSIRGGGVVCDTEDQSVNLCRLGGLAAGATLRIEVSATPTMIGEAPTLFSVTHREPDSDVRNDSVAVAIRAVKAKIGNGGAPP